MNAPENARPIVLIAAAADHPLRTVGAAARYTVIQVHSGARALEQGRELVPHVVLLDAHLPDMSGIEACRLLHGDLRIGHSVPILILAADKPSPEERVAALQAGAWEFLRAPADAHELLLILQTYVQAKQNIDIALAAGLVDPVTGLHSRPALARRARELGALLAREHGALACVVFGLASEPALRTVGSALVHAARLSDVVGRMSPTEFALLAPGTNHAGALRLTERVAAVLCGSAKDDLMLVPGSTLRAGYAAVANLAYSPVDPAELLARATAAARNGEADPGSSWVRRYEPAPAVAAGVGAPSQARVTPPGIVLPDRRTTR